MAIISTTQLFTCHSGKVVQSQRKIEPPPALKKYIDESLRGHTESLIIRRAEALRVRSSLFMSAFRLAREEPQALAVLASLGYQSEAQEMSQDIRAAGPRAWAAKALIFAASKRSNRIMNELEPLFQDAARLSSGDMLQEGEQRLCMEAFSALRDIIPKIARFADKETMLAIIERFEAVGGEEEAVGLAAARAGLDGKAHECYLELIGIYKNDMRRNYTALVGAGMIAAELPALRKDAFAIASELEKSAPEYAGEIYARIGEREKARACLMRISKDPYCYDYAILIPVLYGARLQAAWRLFQSTAKYRFSSESLDDAAGELFRLGAYGSTEAAKAELGSFLGGLPHPTGQRLLIDRLVFEAGSDGTFQITKDISSSMARIMLALAERVKTELAATSGAEAVSLGEVARLRSIAADYQDARLMGALDTVFAGRASLNDGAFEYHYS